MLAREKHAVAVQGDGRLAQDVAQLLLQAWPACEMICPYS